MALTIVLSMERSRRVFVGKHPALPVHKHSGCSQWVQCRCPACALLRYPVFESEHKPYDWGISLGRCIAWVKILGLCTLLRAVGKSREAMLLKNAYTAFSVYNTPRYDRSILSAVDNAAALRVC